MKGEGVVILEKEVESQGVDGFVTIDERPVEMGNFLDLPYSCRKLILH